MATPNPDAQSIADDSTAHSPTPAGPPLRRSGRTTRPARRDDEPVPAAASLRRKTPKAPEANTTTTGAGSSSEAPQAASESSTEANAHPATTRATSESPTESTAGQAPLQASTGTNSEAVDMAQDTTNEGAVPPPLPESTVITSEARAVPQGPTNGNESDREDAVIAVDVGDALNTAGPPVANRSARRGKITGEYLPCPSESKHSRSLCQLGVASPRWTRLQLCSSCAPNFLGLLQRPTRHCRMDPRRMKFLSLQATPKTTP